MTSSLYLGTLRTFVQECFEKATRLAQNCLFDLQDQADIETDKIGKLISGGHNSNTKAGISAFQQR